MIAFILTMPNNNSWNGRWSGDRDLFVIVKKIEKKLANELLEIENFRYRWDDGWTANIEIKEIDSKEANKLRKKSQGFRGYEWMINSIIENKKIIKNN